MSDVPPYRGRFAPSPTGDLHFGSLLTAFASWLRARQAHGRWLIRIEDLDPPREVPGAAAAQCRTLQAFGLESDEAIWYQSERADVYAGVLARLLEVGLAFECRCSRSDLATQGGIHRRCVASDRMRPAAIRARVPAHTVQFDDAVQGRFGHDLAEAVGDFVLRRVDGLHAYQLAVVVDDAAQGITEVVRGADLLDSTPRQIHLQRRLGLPTPAYAHLPLLLDAGGAKLGKSQGAAALDDADPLPALRAAYALLGQPVAALPARGPVAIALECARRNFDPARIPATDTVLPGTE
jgi:glutamyl-Q tRNA(Asp) synthetase